MIPITMKEVWVFLGSIFGLGVAVGAFVLGLIWLVMR